MIYSNIGLSFRRTLPLMPISTIFTATFQPIKATLRPLTAIQDLKRPLFWKVAVITAIWQACWCPLPPHLSFPTCTSIQSQRGDPQADQWPMLPSFLYDVIPPHHQQPIRRAGERRGCWLLMMWGDDVIFLGGSPRGEGEVGGALLLATLAVHH